MNQTPTLLRYLCLELIRGTRCLNLCFCVQVPLQTAPLVTIVTYPSKSQVEMNQRIRIDQIYIRQKYCSPNTPDVLSWDILLSDINS